MKKGTYLIPGILNRCLLALFVIMGFSTVAEASYTATATTNQQYYTAGQSNTFNFTVTMTTNSTFEYVDNIRFTFPAGLTISAASGPEPYQFCGGGTGNKTIAGNVVTWATPGGPGTGCGAFADGGYNFSITVDVPANFSGPLNVTATTLGDGYPFPYTDYQTSNFNLSFAQNLPCVFNCPGSQTFNLSPGECSKVVSYDVSFTGNCDILIPTATTLTQNLDTIGTNAGVAYGINGEGHYRGYDLAAAGISGSYTISSIKVGSYDFSGGGTVQLYVYSFTGTLGGPTLDLTQATQIATSAPVFVAQGTTVNIPIAAVIPAGTKFLVEIRKVSGGTFTIGYNFGGQTAPSYISPAPGTNPTNLAQFGLGNYHVIQVLHGVALQAQAPELILMSGLPSGAEFPIGTTQVMWKLINPFTGDVINTCNFSITVLEYPNPIQSLICNDLVQISLDANCEAVIGADQVLEGGPYGCYDDYIVELDKTAPFGNGPWLPAVLGPSDVGKTYQVRVTDPENNNNKCWGNVKIEDKLPPVLDCPTAYAYCNQSLEPCVNSKPIFVPDPNADPIQFPANFDFLGSGQAWVWDFVDGGYFFDLENTTNEPLAIGSFGIRHWSPDFGNIPSPTIVDVYTAPTSFGNEANAAAWTNLGPAEVDVVPYFATGTGPLSQVELSAPVVIPPGESRGFHIYGRSADPIFNWNFGAQLPDIQNGPLLMKAGFIASGLFEPQTGFGDCIGNIQVNLAIEGELPCLPNDLVLGQDAFPNGSGGYTVTAGTGSPVLEPCSNATLTYVDSEVQQDCASGLTKVVNRKWTATDASGNSATCIQRIEVLRPVLGDVVLPPSYDDINAPALPCNSAYPSPNYLEGLGLQGYPYVFDAPNGCSINWTYDDAVIEVCDGTYKIRRKWTIIDWCTGEDIEHNQILKVLDDAGPAMTCPAETTVGTDPFTCCATTNLPDIIIEDNCSQIASISAMIQVFDPQTSQVIAMHQVGGSLQNFPGNNLWDLDTLGNFGTTPCLPPGRHLVTYQAEDDCGNTSTCTFFLNVVDLTPPVAACDEFTIVGIGVDDPFDCYEPSDACNFAGVTWVKATTFDDGSYDNCGDLLFTIKRMAPYSDCINSLSQLNGHPPCNPLFPNFPSEFERAEGTFQERYDPNWQFGVEGADSIKFYCCEVGTTQTVVLRVYQLDANGLITKFPDGTPVHNQCMIEVSVQDKIKPVCQSPANVSVSCENFDPSLWAYGKASVYDNCCLDTATVYQGQCGLGHSVNLSAFDTVCNKGTITRTFRAIDCQGQSSTCTQRIFVSYEQDYFLRFPNDVIVTVCDGTGNYGEPVFFGEDCELLGVSFEDEVFTVVPDACYKIERTWTIINWCTYDPNKGCVEVPNPNPNAILNHPQNLTGPTISALGTPSPWTPSNVPVAPGQANTNYSVFYHGGTYNGVTIPNIANNNCFKYKQIIKVIDTQDPQVTCPASPVEICDLTPNDPLLWNAMYWYDATINSHDLCEAPTDLCITATDLCSGANLSIRYLLFLDLDGDGTMESVVNSVNTGIAGLGWNAVPYGNAGNPNYGGGQIRQFDGRPVPANQKWGFAIQQTTSGTNRTACVRFNTQQQQNTYLVPELPYGTHKIKWFIEDGCGNETICEYTFVVKDCKKPTVVCINGLSVNIMPTKMIALWDTDFLQYTEDNCTPSGQLVTAIRRSGTGTGFPLNPDGTPQKSVTFTCDDLGTQLVELWSIDKAGNADYCETYVIVQDNMGICDGNSATVAGTLKTEQLNGLEEAKVDLNGSHPALPPVSMFTMSDNAGDYSLAGVPFLGNYTLTPTKDNDPLNGVSTFDLVLINKHILGLEPLNTPYKMIAADANNSRSITTFDIVELRKLILGIYTELPNNTSWRFVDKSYSFPNPSNPFAEIFPETKQIADLQADLMSEHFTSVKVGDVNGNAVSNSLMSADDRTAGTLMFDVEDRAVKAGETFTVNFKATEKVQGYQFTMNYNNLEVMDIVPGTNMKVDNFAVFAGEGALTTSWDGPEASGQAEFGITFRAKAGGQLSQMLGVSSRITKAEAYNAGSERLQVAFRFNSPNGSTISGLGFELYQNTPNPFVNRTQIGFYLPEATSATLTVFDESGRMIYTQGGDFAKGYNAVTIDRSVLNTTGVLYYKLETAKDSATRKMIQSK